MPAIGDAVRSPAAFVAQPKKVLSTRKCWCRVTADTGSPVRVGLYREGNDLLQRSDADRPYESPEDVRVQRHGPGRAVPDAPVEQESLDSILQGRHGNRRHIIHHPPQNTYNPEHQTPDPPNLRQTSV